jgi:hypothetical protein
MYEYKVLSRLMELLSISRPPRPIRAWLACALLCAGVSACGGSNASSTSTRTSTPSPAASATSAANTVVPAAARDKDRDNDGGGADDTNHRSTEAFGHAASASDARAIAALVKRYFEIALSGNGARGCALLYSTLEEAVPEDYGGPGGGPPPSGSRRTCPEVLGETFAREHTRLAAQVPKLAVRRVRVFERHGLVFLSFGPHLPEREIAVMREGSIWRMEALSDSELP